MPEPINDRLDHQMQLVVRLRFGLECFIYLLAFLFLQNDTSGDYKRGLLALINGA